MKAIPYRKKGEKIKMSKLMSIAAKTPSNTWAGFNLDNNGQLKTTKNFGTTIETIMNGESIRDTSTHDATALNISEYAYTSIRFENSLDSVLTIYFRNDRTTGSSSYLIRPDGSYMSISIPSKSTVIVTPNDLPELPYLNLLRPISVCSTTPTEGTLSIRVICKK